ncbi:MAG: Zn-ribbon domain-containing OB-fold protein [Dehalococcoidia bacterium]|nr:MAG: Zn-ribbon domain-containing OB-fold protein [Dehalococcoidia bacterium]
MAVRSEDMGNTGTLKYPSRIRLQYTWHAGQAGSKFYSELRDNCKILGTKCSRCGWVYVPPRETCPRCFVDITDWVDLGDTGTLLTYTVTRYAVPAIQPVEPPYALGIVKLDGASSGFVHLLGEVEPDELEVGMRMKAVFNEERTGGYLDIKYFKPVGA